jgi:hypothetical protein
MVRAPRATSVAVFDAGRKKAIQSGASSDHPTLGLAPLCLPNEKEALANRLKGVTHGGESLLVLEFENYFSSGLKLEYVVSFMLCVNALTMWKTGGAVTRLLVLAGDVSMQPSGQLYAFANQFRSLMQGGFARIDNATLWMEHLGINLDIEPLDFRDFRRAVRVFSAARVSPDEVPALAYAEWYFGFRMPGSRKEPQGHFNYDTIGSHSVRISNSEVSLNVEFEDRFSSGPCEILSSPSHSTYQVSVDLTGTRSPFSGETAARYLDVFSSLIGIQRRT